MMHAVAVVDVKDVAGFLVMAIDRSIYGTFRNCSGIIKSKEKKGIG